MTDDFRTFLRLMSDDWLTALRDRVAEDILARTRTTSFSYVGKSGTTELEIPTPALAQQLAEVLGERGIGGAQPVTRMTLARFK